MDTTIFAVTFICLFVGHSVGDHWVQTGHQAVTKQKEGRTARATCARHVATLTATKLAILIPVLIIAGARPHLGWLCVGVLVDAGSHYWADRGKTIENLARVMKKSPFHDLGSDTVHQSSPAGSHLGTGRYALDQSFHHLFLLVGSVLIAL